MPPFETRYPHRLESMIGSLDQGYYEDLVDYAARVFYGFCTRHVFTNGNKRMAVVAAFFFLLKNDKFIQMNRQTLGLYAVWAARSRREDEENTLRVLRGVFSDHLIEAPKPKA